MSIEAALRQADELQEFIEKNHGGYRDDAALRHIQSLTIRLEGAVPSVGYEAGSLRHWAEILFSTRKHQRWGGPAKVYSMVFEDCYRIKMKLEHHLHSIAETNFSR